MANEDHIIAVYMMANRKHGTLYAGVTSDLVRRVWYEIHDEISEAIRREKSLKSYRRRNKINLITEKNPDWKDLWFEITG